MNFEDIIDQIFERIRVFVPSDGTWTIRNDQRKGLKSGSYPYRKGYWFRIHKFFITALSLIHVVLIVGLYMIGADRYEVKKNLILSQLAT